MTGRPTARPARGSPASPMRPAGRPTLIAHAPRPAGDAERADWLARRLHARHRGEPVRVLEALAATLVARLAADGDPGALQRVPLPGDPHLAVCRRIARRALAGAPQPPDVAGATRYHHADVHPAWARGRIPCGTLGDFVFYP